MSARVALALLLALCMTALSPLIGSAVAATQVTAQEEESEGQDEGGQDPETETGADEGQAEGAEEETGPPWTYQMARMGIALMVVLALGIGLAYYRFVTKRQRGVI
jgi:uncharacterized protein HemX